MTAQHRRLKLIEFSLGGNRFECQVSNWSMINNSEDGEKFWTFCTDGEFIEDTDPDYALELKFFSDWRLNGVSDYLQTNDNNTVAFQLDHLPDIAGEHVRWTGQVKIKAPTVGGEARATEMTEITLQVVGKPIYTRI